VLRWIVHQHMDVVILAVHLHELRLKIHAHLGEDGMQSLDGVSVKDPIAILCDEDQVNMKVKDAMSTVSNFT
jgi:hypothetical protein